MGKKRNEYPGNIWGLIAWLFQNEFLKLFTVALVAAIATYMFFNFSCDSEGPRIEKTNIEIKKKAP